MEKNNDKNLLYFLYNSPLGRIILKFLTARWISSFCGMILNSKLSKPLIKGFVKKNNIDLSQYESQKFNCFNDCFCRKIKPELRPIDRNANNFIAPCDGLLSTYRIKEDTVFPIKQSSYTVSDLLGGSDQAAKFKDGICLVFRLCVDHYHRYCYVDNLKKGDNTFIKGVLHTVRPVALRKYPVFVQNCREYTFLETENFGTVAQIEVGAMLVGKIKNLHKEGRFSKGEEKGMFLYGGSTIVLLLEKDKVKLKTEYFEKTEKGIEVPVKMGECIGKSVP